MKYMNWVEGDEERWKDSELQLKRKGRFYDGCDAGFRSD